jgi:hypothetical protein
MDHEPMDHEPCPTERTKWTTHCPRGSQWKTLGNISHGKQWSPFLIHLNVCPCSHLIPLHFFIFLSPAFNFQWVHPWLCVGTSLLAASGPAFCTRSLHTTIVLGPSRSPLRSTTGSIMRRPQNVTQKPKR